MIQASRFRTSCLTAWLLCILVACAGFVMAQDSDYQTAVSLVQQRQFDRVLPLLQQILDRAPNDLKTRNLMGIALSAAGRREEANEQFKKVLALDSQFAPALKNLAINELALGRIQDARLHFEAAQKLLPQDPTCHWGLAEIAFAARDFRSAADHYEQSGDMVWRDLQVAIKFATCWIEIKQPARAMALLEKIPLDANAKIQFQAGVMLTGLEKFDAAARRFRLAREGSSDPDQRYLIGYNLTLVLIKNGEHAAAIKAAEEVLTAGHRQAEMYNLLSQAYEQSGRTIQAYDALRTASEIDPRDETNYLDLIALCLRHENYDLSLEIADIGVRRIPGSHRLHLQRGVALVMKGQLEEAIREFQTAGQLSPADGLPQVALGLALLQVDRQAEAVTVLRRQSDRSPEDPRVFWLLGEALSRSGNRSDGKEEKEAVGALERSIRLDPRWSQSRALLGKLLLRGEVDRAVQELELAIKLDPDDLSATYQLAQALQRKGQTERARQLFAKVNQAKSEKLQPAQRNLIRIIKADPQSH